MLQACEATLKTIVAAEVEAVLARRPDLALVKVAVRAKDNWTLLARALPDKVERMDFYHAVEYLEDAFDSNVRSRTHTPRRRSQS